MERHIGILYDLTRVYVLQSNVPRLFLSDAMRHACYVLNTARVPRGMDMTPQEAFTGKRTDYSHPIRFFQQGMSWRSHEERVGKGKMCPKSDIVRYLGHAPNYKDSYLCYNPANLSVKVRHGLNLTMH